jgi:phosphatidylethanolamine-binding protein (PEBP) family uncharacterized protein
MGEGNVMRGPTVRTCLCAATAALLLASCGGGGSSTSTVTVSAVPTSPAAAAPASPTASAQATAAGTSGSGASTSAVAVAYVAGTPIPKAAYKHWLTVERKLGGAANASHRALGFLITSQWLVGEAAARRVTVPEAAIKQRYDHEVSQNFSQAGSLSKFEASSGETEADLLARIRVELLLSRTAAQVAGSASGSRRSALLADYERTFHAHWQALTTCEPGYVMEDCREYRGGPEDLTATTTRGAASTAAPATAPVRAHGSSAAAPATSSTSSAPSSHGEVYPTPGGFSVSSPAFGRNGAIPAQYTCVGAGTSPPLTWERVPAGAAELVLFVIDDSSAGSSGGVRWIVGGIDPSSTGVAAGAVPAGGIVGTSTAGKAAYSPICPAPGHSDTVEFVVYALKKTIPLSPGFQPAVAEHEYGAGNLILGQSAVTYGIASR